jgi:hypothetical protein
MLSRRSFLGLAGGVVLLAACGGDDDSDASSATTAAGQMHHDHGDEFTELRPAVLAGDLYASAEPQRFAFAMTAKEGFASFGTVRLAVAPEGGQPATFFATTLHTEGLPERRGVFVTDLVLDRAGIWDAVADLDGDLLPFVFQVHDTASAPIVGAAAPRAASPTTTATLEVDPICTHDPQCPLHDRSLDALIGAGTPVAVLFATPARCKSEYCQPVLDSLLALVDEYQDRIAFVHVDIYENARSEKVAPTVAAWNLPSEPFLFGVDAAGTITGRLDGAFAQDEMRALLDQLVT